MRKKLTIIYIAVFILFLFHLNIGCDGKSEQSPKAVAISKKIVSKNSGSSISPAQAPAVVAENRTADVKKAASDISAAKVDEKAVKHSAHSQLNVSSGNIPNQPLPKVAELNKEKEIDKQKTGTVSADLKSAAIGSGEHSSSSISPGEMAKLQPEGAASYNPEGKIDPFAPLFKEGVAVGKGKKMRTPRTPLEMIDLGQLKLVAIIRASSGNKALVEEASGKGYIVAKGTYIGNNSGRIIKILNDRVIIEEEIENIVGKKTIQERELKLQKPLGEE